MIMLGNISVEMKYNQIQNLLKPPDEKHQLNQI